MGEGNSHVPWRSVALLALALVPFGILWSVSSEGAVYAIALLTACFVAYLAWSHFVMTRAPGLSSRITTPALFAVLAVVLGAVVVSGLIPRSAVSVVHLIALTMAVIYLWIVASLALYHRYRTELAEPSPPYESISILIPAFNEEGYVGKTVQALLDADYPADKREVIVVDDGSDDGTFEEARELDSEQVTVVRKRNGGKYSALNYGLLFASGEFVVVVDADSIVTPDALKQIVAPLQRDSEIGAVASRVKIANRNGLVTRCQRLEYVVSTNIPRRMLDLFGVVTVVPGCLGAFRREAMEAVFAYDPDTLTEDFDLTLKILRNGWSVRISDALVYTEAPATWTDLYNQRLRWYRGNYMSIFKHYRIITDSSYGYLHRIAVPFRLGEMFIVPLAGWVILAAIVGMILEGQAIVVLGLFLVFTSIVVLISLIAISIEGESWTLAVVAPLFVVGYKQFKDLITLKSLLDVLLGEELGWTRARRVEQSQQYNEADES